MSTKNENEPFWASILFAAVQGVVNAVTMVICLKILGVI